MLKKVIISIILLVLLTNVTGKTAQAEFIAPGPAFFYLSLDKDTFFNPDYLAFDLKLETANLSVNAVSVLLDFDAEKLTLIGAEKDGSMCNLFINEEINNQDGRYALKCGSTSPIEAFQNQIVRLTFRKNALGLTTLNILGESEAFINDGIGTKLSTVNEDQAIEIVK